MIVEDDPVILDRLSKVVDNNDTLSLHTNVSTVASAKEAILKSPPDVLLVDLRKLSVNSRAEAVFEALKMNLI